MGLYLGSLKTAVASLERALRVAERSILGAVDTDLEEVVRAGVIQNFEFTYELCWKTMRRYLADQVGASAVDGLSRKELFRLAAQHRVIDEVDLWFSFHEARNETSHIYDYKMADRVYSRAQAFLAAAQSLVSQLETHHA